MVQVCSAIQNQDFSLIEDYCTGLKALLYLDGRWPNWDGQSPPTIKHQLGKPSISYGDRKLPNFGHYRETREDLRRQQNQQNVDVILHHGTPALIQNAKYHDQIPQIKDIIGRSLVKIGNYKKLDNSKQVVALIDDVSFYLRKNN